MLDALLVILLIAIVVAVSALFGNEDHHYW